MAGPDVAEPGVVANDGRGPPTTRRTLLKRGALAVAGTGLPAGSADAKPVGVAPTDHGLMIQYPDRVVEVRLSAPGVASVFEGPPGRPPDLGRFGRDAHTAFGVTRDAETLRLSGEGIRVRADLRTGRLAFAADDGKTRVGQTAAPAPIAGVPIASVHAFAISADHALHGLGQFRDPVPDYRGRTIFLQHANMDAVNPFLVSGDGWGMLWDTGTAAYLRADGGTLSWHGIAGGPVRYHVVVGDDIGAVIGGYRRLTGKAQLLGKWAYGYWQSKERYASADELVAVVERYRSEGLPLDAVVLDWRYWGDNDQFSGMTFDPVHFPDPAGMVAHVHAQNAHMLASVWPAFGPDTAIHREMAAAGHLFAAPHWSGGRVFDASSAEARAIYWRHIDQGLMRIGMDGLWTDGCEPEFMSTGNRYVTARSYSANGRDADGPIVRNLLTFSFDQSQGLSTAMRAAYPERRPVILTRSVYAGQQAFGAVTWSGDIFASWQTLRNQIVAAMQMSLSGNPHWTCDIGGFLVHHRFPAGLADPAWRELYVRWFQFGAFLPVFRAHGTDVPRELWQFGRPGEAVYDALAAALRQRYALMPYIYATAAHAARDDGTILRPLAMDFPDDPTACAQSAQYCLGPALMVRVVDRPLFHPPENAQEFIPNDCVRGRAGPAAEVTFFAGAGFERRVATGLSDDLKMSWFGDLPDALHGKPWSARWRGTIRAAETGTHEFVVTWQGALRFELAGKVRIDAADTGSRASDADGGVSARANATDRRERFAVDLRTGEDYPFALQQRQATPDAVSLWVEWITPRQRALATPPAAAAIDVYLPRGADWHDLASGRIHRGGQHMTVPAPLEAVPLFARAGSIVPMTPGIVHAAQAPAETELHVYAGADGRFELYDDSGDGDGYRRGESVGIVLAWHDADRRLDLAAAAGTFEGAPAERRFAVHLHDGDANAQPPQRIVHRGQALSVRFRDGQR